MKNAKICDSTSIFLSLHKPGSIFKALPSNHEDNRNVMAFTILTWLDLMDNYPHNPATSYSAPFSCVCLICGSVKKNLGGQ